MTDTTGLVELVPATVPLLAHVHPVLKPNETVQNNMQEDARSES